MAKLLTTLEVARQLGIESVSVRARVHRLRKRGIRIGKLAHSGRHGGAETLFSQKEVTLLKRNGLGGEQPNQWTVKKTRARKQGRRSASGVARARSGTRAARRR